jgi:hypothetical protein
MKIFPVFSFDLNFDGGFKIGKNFFSFCLLENFLSGFVLDKTFFRKAFQFVKLQI